MKKILKLPGKIEEATESEQQRQMKSSSSGQNQSPLRTGMKMTEEMYNHMANLGDRPRFVCIIHTDDEGKICDWHERTTDFPAENVIPALQAAADGFQTKYLDHVKKFNKD